MALLLRDREAAPEATGTGGPSEGDELIVVPDYACAACGAGMEAGQDWCLECGTAAPGRLGARPGWRAAATVVATTLLLVMGAVVASYAAISGDAQREAARPAPEAAEPIIAQTPPPAAPVLPTVPAPPAPAAPAVPAPVTPAPQATPAPTPPAPAPAPSPAPSQPSQPALSFSLLDLPPGSLRNYDPYDRAGAEIGPPGAAADGLEDTVWDVTVPADGEPIAVGLVVNLRKARLVESVKLDSPTPGYTVEVYGTDASGTPPDILDKRWDRLASRRDAKGTETIDLTRGDAKGPFRRLVLWFTRAGDEQDPRVAIGEIGVRATR